MARGHLAILFSVAVLLSPSNLPAESPRTVFLSRADYQDRVHAAWLGQIIAAMIGWPFEHQVAAVRFVDQFQKTYSSAPVDDDWYYEMVALRAFEKFGPGLTIEQLGRQWLENRCGSWGSSEQARLLLERGLNAPDTGHPRFNRLWFTIGPQFSSEIYGLLSPAQPNAAGRLARELGHINGYAEAVDGAVFVAAMVSLGFAETDPREIVRQAARMIHPDSPCRQCIDDVIALADKGAGPREIAEQVERRWHRIYPATNNAVANGGLVAIAVWFGEADFLKTINLAYQAADFTDADCNAANAAAVIGAMRGLKALPRDLVAQLHDRIAGTKLGPVNLTPPVDEKISELARRTAAIGESLLKKNGGRVDGDRLIIPVESVRTQPLEKFQLADLMKFWNPDWALDRAGFGGAGGGMAGLRGITYLDGEVLATYPDDEVRGVVLRRTIDRRGQPVLEAEVAAEPGRAWELEIYVENKMLFRKLIEGKERELRWEHVRVPIPDLGTDRLNLRLYQRVLIPGKLSGNAYWKHLHISE